MRKLYIPRSTRAVSLLLWLGTAALTSETAATGAGIAGHYRLHDGPDVASELILRPDHKFDYFLTAGSLDEQASGRWEVNGEKLQLTTIPKPVPATFSAGRTMFTDDRRFAVHVTNPAGRGIESVHLTLGFDTGPAVNGYTQEYGWTLEEVDTRAPRWIEFSVPIHHLRSARFPIDPSKGNDVTFVLVPNDLGTLDFESIQIDVQPHRLIMHRDGALMTYEEAKQ